MVNLYAVAVAVAAAAGIALTVTCISAVVVKMGGKDEKDDDEGADGEGEDRISNLPDGVLLHIISSLTTREAVQTCILSKRWLHLWKRIPHIRLHTMDFIRTSAFFRFVAGIVSGLDGNYPLRSIDFSCYGEFPAHIMRSLMTYAFSHDIQKLKMRIPYHFHGLDRYVFSGRSLTYLDLSVSERDTHGRTTVPDHINLPVLQCLRLHRVPFTIDEDYFAEPFSTCPMLQTLIIDHVGFHPFNRKRALKEPTLIISSRSLVNLTILNHDEEQIVIIAPNLTSFTLNGSQSQRMIQDKAQYVELRSSSLA